MLLPLFANCSVAVGSGGAGILWPFDTSLSVRLSLSRATKSVTADQKGSGQKDSPC